MSRLRFCCFFLLAACIHEAGAQDAQPVPVLMGYVTAPPTAASLQIDGRPVQLRPDTIFQCGNTSALIGVTNGLPRFVTGAELAIYGKWSKKQSAFVADSVCGMDTPAKEVTGSAVIDAVLPAADGVTMLSDGRVLRMAAQKGILSIDPPLPGGGAPKPGEWLNYKAHRNDNGTYTVTAAELRLPPFGPNDKHVWNPVALVAPSEKGPGKFQPAHLIGPWKLPYNPSALARLQRVGQSVIPAWERSLPEGAPDKWPIAFYVLAGGRSLGGKDCLSFPNGTILVWQKTLATLKRDDELAGLLSGCVAEVLEEQSLRLLPKVGKADIAEAASLAAPAVAGLGMLVGGVVYANHIENEIRAQSTRVQLTYLAMAHLLPGSAPAAWETLQGKDGIPRWDKQPDNRADRLYKEEAENSAALAQFLAAEPH
jgi:hypothetical protein